MNTRQRFLGSAILLCGACWPGFARADPVRMSWPQPGGAGTSVYITYSYSNLFDGSFLLLDNAGIRAATEEALALWSNYAPLHFIEKPDYGPVPADLSYAPADHPQIRLGHHPMTELAHAYYPTTLDGLGGDVHFDAGIPWTIGEGHWNFLEAVTHELGHALGLIHELDRPAIMNPSYPQQRFHALGTAFLLPADIEQLQSLYGSRRGSVKALDPVPDPATIVLVATGSAILLRARRRRLEQLE